MVAVVSGAVVELLAEAILKKDPIQAGLLMQTQGADVSQGVS